jgi:CheY-like chemotaxis protein
MLISLLREAQRKVGPMPIIGCCVGAMASRAAAAGAAGYLVKPLRREQICEVVQGLETTHKRVLVVDDEPEQCAMMELLLQSADGEISAASALDGHQALAYIERERPNLVLLDVIMPGMDGWEVLTAVQKLPAAKDIRVVMVSAEDPAQRPVMSDLIMATIGEGLSVGKLLSCSRGLASLLKQPD